MTLLFEDDIYGQTLLKFFERRGCPEDSLPASPVREEI
jgi:hypothetical protein